MNPLDTRAFPYVHGEPDREFDGYAWEYQDGHSLNRRWIGVVLRERNGTTYPRPVRCGACGENKFTVVYTNSYETSAICVNCGNPAIVHSG
jgi:hypothetical protein